MVVEISTFEKLEHKTLMQCDANADAEAVADTDADADDRGDFNSSPCTSYRRAKMNFGSSANPRGMRFPQN